VTALRRLSVIVDAGARVQAVRERLDRLGPDAFVAELDTLARDAARGASAADVDAMLACALWLSNDGRPRIAELLLAAKNGEHPVAIAMLDDEPAHKQLSRHGRLPHNGGPAWIVRHAHIWSPPDSRLWPQLDEIRRLLALPLLVRPAKHDPADDVGSWEKVPLPRLHIATQVGRLGMRPDAPTIRTLLRDRAVAVKDVVKIAARRPTTPAIVDEVIAHAGWMAHPAVRTAIVENPFTPTRTALLLLPTCRARLRSVGKANVHRRLHALAALLAA
jgi:hypothetical protein